MATEEKIILSADVTKAVSTIGELKDEIKELKTQLDKAEIGTEEYNDTLSELQKQQNALKAVMAGSVDAFNAIQNSTEGATKSYNSLTAEMAKLKAAWRASTDEAERANLGEKINAINDQLKSLDASTGNFQRNVGNYAGGFGKALQGITDKVTSLQSPLAMAKSGVMQLGTAFKALIANPIGATIAALVVVIKGIVDGFRSSETATRSLQRAFSAFEPIINMIKNAFAYLAEGIGVALEYSAKFVSFLLGTVIPGYKEAQAESSALADKEQALQDRRRKFAVEEAKTMRDISDLRDKAAQKDKYTAEQRKQFLDQAVALEKKLGAERLAIAQEQFDIDKRRADQAPNDAAANDKLAESEANLYNVEKQVSDKTRELNSQLSELNRSANAAASGGVSDLQRALDSAGKFSDGYDVDAGEGGTKVEAPDWSDAIDDADQYAEALKAVKEAQLYTGSDYEQMEYDLMTTKLQYEKRLELAQQFGLDTEALTREYYQRTANIENDFRKKQLKEDKAQQKARVGISMQFLNATSGLLNTLAAMYESDTDASEDELRKAKNLKIAGAVMNTIEGAVGAYVSGINSGIPSPGNMILAVMQAATATMAGMANVKQIASTQVSKESGASTSISTPSMSLPSSADAVVQAPALDTVIESVRTITTASEEDKLNQSQKVYLVTDELEMAQNSKRVRMAESTF